VKRYERLPRRCAGGARNSTTHGDSCTIRADIGLCETPLGLRVITPHRELAIAIPPTHQVQLIDVHCELLALRSNRHASILILTPG